jgi:hypothetical protein
MTNMHHSNASQKGNTLDGTKKRLNSIRTLSTAMPKGTNNNSLKSFFGVGDNRKCIIIITTKMGQAMSVKPAETNQHS